MAENLKGEAVVAATRAAGWAGWAGGVRDGLGASASEATEPEAWRRKPGAQGAWAWRAGLGGAEGRGRVLWKAAGLRRSGDSGRGRAPQIATGRRARARAQGVVQEAAPARGKISRR